MEAVRILNFKWNYLKVDGSYLFDDHVLYCYKFSEGFGRVYYCDNISNLVNSEGKTLLKNNVDNCRCFENGFAKILINKIWYLIDKECNFYNENKVSFKELYQEYPQKRQELINIIQEYTYFDVNEYFNI